MTTLFAAGLTDAEVAQRVAAGKTNDVPTRAARSVSEIVRANVFTRINAILGVLLVIVLSTGSVINGAFGLLIIANSAIGIIQELRAKQTLDKLAIVGQAKPLVRRQSGTQALMPSAVVLDDVIELGPGIRSSSTARSSRRPTSKSTNRCSPAKPDRQGCRRPGHVGQLRRGRHRRLPGHQGRPRSLRRQARRRSEQVHAGEIRIAQGSTKSCSSSPTC